MRSERTTISNLFIILVVMMVLLPFITTFQDILTRIILYFDFYRSFQNLVIPYEMRVVASILNFINLPTRAGPSYIEFVREEKVEVIYLAWNCIGWQSFIFLIITLISGLSGKHTIGSKLQALLVGALGTYLVNIFRLVLVIVMYYYTGRGLGVVFHDYFSNLLSITWLFVFWWIAYSFVLVPKREGLAGSRVGRIWGKLTGSLRQTRFVGELSIVFHDLKKRFDFVLEKGFEVMDEIIDKIVRKKE